MLEHLPDGTPVYAVGGRVTPPKVIHAPDPRYPSTPYKMRIQGVPVLTIIVDQQGNVRMPRIARAVGLGFDDEAARVVQTWSFQPAMLDGRPVASLVNVEVSFRLF